MVNPTEIIPGVIFYSYLATKTKQTVGFLNHNNLVMQVSGQFLLETPTEKITMRGGQMLLIGKNQLGQITKTPLPDEDYETIVISLQEDLLRQIALEENIEMTEKYNGPQNVLVPGNDFLRAFFHSLVPYVRHADEHFVNTMGMLKVREAVHLLLNALPELKNFLFDFSEPHKIDLEKFMLSNFHYNLPVEKFASLTGRSLAGFKRDFRKIFDMAPRHWLQEKRLEEARYLIEDKHKRPSAIYLDLGFESLSHFSHSFKKRFRQSAYGIMQKATEYLTLRGFFY
ncbi:helix-turn-helix domain-containing protein [Mucilaginibacter pedocola]|uniref:AraC family transcriptional regulator n=1 Tax=Mucilaginibacter pedocola TaxID=1792845 RepID=A0A1S9P9J1_9SPHI|nr:AraC family transcriptional regulator [Mucilaginibacter pedocola]OOQ57497.1 AraC family transcriptional regulator [Mucilaginibacter pedocola]